LPPIVLVNVAYWEHGELTFQPAILELLQEAQRIAAGEALSGHQPAIAEQSRFMSTRPNQHHY